MRSYSAPCLVGVLLLCGCGSDKKSASFHAEYSQAGSGARASAEKRADAKADFAPRYAPAPAMEAQSGRRALGMTDSARPNYDRIPGVPNDGTRPEPAPNAFEHEQAGAPLQGPLSRDFNTAAYDHIEDNAFQAVGDNPLSTFSIDVDTASYSIVRRFLRQGQLPPKGAVRIEEFVNYFPYEYSPPIDGRPFAVHVEVAGCPWNAEHRLARIALKGRVLPAEERPAANLVFLVDVSGSMNAPTRLPLVKRSMKLLLEQLGPRDRVAIVVYAGAAGLVLPSTPCAQKHTIAAALDRLSAGGSTAGGAGIQLAYETAHANYDPGRVNRVILCTDGDFNVGVTSQSELVELVQRHAKRGVYLTALGFGMDNLKDSMLEKLADKGNGNYGYIDTLHEARKILVEQLSGTLVTVAKDVKLQIELNPAQVAAYRLIGYENRLLRKEDFNDDTKDAGEIGAGHTVTALYELVPAGKDHSLPKVDPLKYQQPAPRGEVAASDELLTLKLRYKQPDADKSELLEYPVRDSDLQARAASADFRFAAAVAAFGMLLRESPHKGAATFESVRQLANEARGTDPSGYRGEFIELVERASQMRR